jgi:Cu2+-exporting ATPase
VSGVTAASLVMMLTFIFIYPIHGGWLTVEDYGAMRRLAFEAVPIFLFFLTTILVFFVGWPILRGAWIGLRARLPNMDVLLALAILAAYGYSIIQFFNRSIDLYFEVAGTLVMIVTIGRYLERGARARATESLQSILQAWAPRPACCAAASISTVRSTRCARTTASSCARARPSPSTAASSPAAARWTNR